MFSPLNKLKMSQEHQGKNKNYKPIKLGFTYPRHSYLGTPFLKVSEITSCGTFMSHIRIGRGPVKL